MVKRASFVIALLACFPFIGTSMAFTTTYTSTISLTSPDWTLSFSIPQWDPLGGAISKVTIDWTADLSSTFQAENINASFPANNVSQSSNATMNLYKVGDLVNILDTLTPSLSVGGVGTTLPVYDGTLDYGGSSGYTTTKSTNGTFSTNYTAFADILPFYGTGTVTFKATGTAVNNTSSTGGTVVGNINPMEGGTLKVSYEYVPEPGTLALVGFGLLGLVGFTRRRKAAKDEKV